MSHEVQEKEIILRKFAEQVDNVNKEKSILELTLLNTESNMQDVLNELNSNKEASIHLN